MEHISSALNQGKKKSARVTERGELLRYFKEKLNTTRLQDGLPPLSMPRMGRVLENIPTKDLYYLQSVCDESQKRGGLSAFSKKFWWEIDPKKHIAPQKEKKFKIEK